MGAQKTLTHGKQLLRYNTMKLSDKLQDIWRAATGKPQLWRTPYGNIELARNAKEAKTLLAQLQRTTEALTRSDMRKWHRAWQQAISVEFPDRRELYDVYRDALIDAHLSGCIDQRIGFVLARSFNIENADGEPQPELHHYFEQEWFDQFCRMVLSTPYWGHSLIEVGNIVTDGDGCPTFDGIHLIDRRYVIPEHHRVITDLGQTWETGIDYHERPWSDRLVEVGQPADLGLLLKASQHTIPKKNVLAAWDLFSEVFGIPLRVARTASRNQKDVDRIDQMMQRMGMASYAVLPLDTEIQIVENAKSDAFNVYDKRIDRANSELSKLIIGQTMTIEDGSSLSQSQTHLEVFQNIVEQDASLLAHTVNNQLLPLMVRMGWPLQGMHFAWDEAIDYTPEQQIQYEQMVADRYEVDPAYFADKYSMPVGERIQQPSLFGSEEGRVKSEGSDTEKQLARPFFD